MIIIIIKKTINKVVYLEILQHTIALTTTNVIHTTEKTIQQLTKIRGRGSDAFLGLETS